MLSWKVVAWWFEWSQVLKCLLMWKVHRIHCFQKGAMLDSSSRIDPGLNWNINRGQTTGFYSKSSTMSLSNMKPIRHFIDKLMWKSYRSYWSFRLASWKYHILNPRSWYIYLKSVRMDIAHLSRCNNLMWMSFNV